jgi:hypothetical protein
MACRPWRNARDETSLCSLLPACGLQARKPREARHAVLAAGFPNCFSLCWMEAMPREVSTIDRLARQMCKALSATPEMERITLEQTIIQETGSDVAKLSTGWRRKRAPRDGDVERAFTLASSNGWISERDGLVVLTEQGQEMARRSRVGRTRQRSSFF